MLGGTVVFSCKYCLYGHTYNSIYLNNNTVFVHCFKVHVLRYRGAGGFRLTLAFKRALLT